MGTNPHVSSLRAESADFDRGKCMTPLQKHLALLLRIYVMAQIRDQIALS